MDTMKSAVGKVSEVVFPGIKVAYKQSVIQRRGNFINSLFDFKTLVFMLNVTDVFLDKIYLNFLSSYV